MKSIHMLAVLLVVTSSALADDLQLTVDGKTLPKVRVRLNDKTVWVKTAWVAKHLRLTVERPQDGGPVVVCQADLCHLGSPKLLTDDGKEVDLDGVLAVVGARIELKVTQKPMNIPGKARKFSCHHPSPCSAACSTKRRVPGTQVIADSRSANTASLPST